MSSPREKDNNVIFLRKGPRQITLHAQRASSQILSALKYKLQSKDNQTFEERHLRKGQRQTKRKSNWKETE